MVISAAHNVVTKRVVVERVCMIFSDSFWNKASELVGRRALRKIYVAFLCALVHLYGGARRGLRSRLLLLHGRDRLRGLLPDLHEVRGGAHVIGSGTYAPLRLVFRLLFALERAGLGLRLR